MDKLWKQFTIVVITPTAGTLFSVSHISESKILVHISHNGSLSSWIIHFSCYGPIIITGP